MSFVKEVLPSKTEIRSAEMKKKASDMIEAAKKEDAKLVKGLFKNLISEGGDASFAYRAYKGDPIRVYTLVDGETYTIPLGVAKHINNQCQYQKSKYLLDKEGEPMVGLGKPTQRYQFISTDFM